MGSMSKPLFVTIVMIVVLMLIASTLICGMDAYERGERSKASKGDPDYQGVVTSSDHIPGGFGQDDLTDIVIGNNSVAIAGYHSFTIGQCYKIWLWNDGDSAPELAKKTGC